MMAIPIWLSMVWDSELVNTSGATSNTSANSDQTSQRPML